MFREFKLISLALALQIFKKFFNKNEGYENAPNTMHNVCKAYKNKGIYNVRHKITLQFLQLFAPIRIITRSISMVSKPFVFEVFVVKSVQ